MGDINLGVYIFKAMRLFEISQEVSLGRKQKMTDKYSINMNIDFHVKMKRYLCCSC